MPDWHMVNLRYQVKHDQTYEYIDVEPVEFERPEARFRLASGELLCEMKMHFATEEDARAAIEPVLRAWEIAADLTQARGSLRFELAGSYMVDRSGQKGSIAKGHVNLTVIAAPSVAKSTIYSNYPNPPTADFHSSADLQGILDRYFGYLDGREPLLPMAYFCLTKIENMAGSRKLAAQKYRTNVQILRKIGELTSLRGDRLTARKASARQPLSHSEKIWIESALKKIIWQLFVPEHLRSWLEMSDLPKL